MDIYYSTVGPSTSANFGCVPTKEVARSGDVVLYAVSVGDEVFVNELHVLCSRGFIREGKFFAFGKSAVDAVSNLCRFCEEETSRVEENLSLCMDMGVSARLLRCRLCPEDDS